MTIADYDVSEVHRQPMTEVALRLKSMLASVPSSGTAVANTGEGKCYLLCWRNFSCAVEVVCAVLVR
jgi:hypothetical protein